MAFQKTESPDCSGLSVFKDRKDLTGFQSRFCELGLTLSQATL
jgi:hypothetical protein